MSCIYASDNSCTKQVGCLVCVIDKKINLTLINTFYTCRKLTVEQQIKRKQTKNGRIHDSQCAMLCPSTGGQQLPYSIVCKCCCSLCSHNNRFWFSGLLFCLCLSLFRLRPEIVFFIQEVIELAPLWVAILFFNK